MTEPTKSPVPKPSRLKGLTVKLAAVFVWASSPEGRKDIGAAVAAFTAIYTAVHRAGF